MRRFRVHLRPVSNRRVSVAASGCRNLIISQDLVDVLQLIPERSCNCWKILSKRISNAMSCYLVGLGEEGAGENSFPPPPPPSPRRRPSTSHYGRRRDGEKCPFCQEEGREGAGVSPGQHRRARGGSAVALPQGTIDSNLSTGQGRDPRWVGSFFGSGSSGYFKGHRPVHTLFLFLSVKCVRTIVRLEHGLE